MSVLHAALQALESHPALLAAVLLVVKVTLLLAAAWSLHFCLTGCNPRWRVLVWRAAAVALVLVAALSFCPPLVPIAVLSPLQPTDANQDAGTLDARPPFLPAVSGRSEIGSDPQPAPGDFSHAISADTHVPGGDVRVDRSRTNFRQAASEEAVTVLREPANADSSVNEAEQPTAGITRVPGTPSAGRLGSGQAGGIGVTTWLLVVWLAAAAAIVVRIAVGTWRIRRIRGRAIGTPAWIVEECEQVARRLGCERPVRVLASADVTVPCLVGLRRPAILLPFAECENTQDGQLSAVLAHEISHLMRRDLNWSIGLDLIAALLWFHPLTWRVRQAHLAACEAVSDAVAADYLGNVADYGRVLARMAVRLSSPAALMGVAMARTSNVRQRIEAVQRHLFRSELPRSRAILMLAIGAIVVGLMGTVALTRSNAETTADQPVASEPAPNADDPAAAAVRIEQEASVSKPQNLVAEAATEQAASESDKPQPATDRMIVRAVADETGKPLEQVKLRFHGRINQKRFDQTDHTNSDGEATLQWPAGAAIQHLWMTAGKPEFVPVHHTWRGERRKIELPAKLDLRFHAGSLVGGVVRDESGQPIAGAEVVLSMPVTWPVLDSYVFYAAELASDREGRWQWTDAPADLGSVGLRVTHPDYLKGGGRITNGLENLTVLKQGLQVTGRILDESGKPVEGAIAQLGFDRFGSGEPQATTDQDGRYVLKNCKPGKSAVTASAEGLGPQIKDVYVAEATDPVDFQLQPGHVLKGRVVDVGGNPLAGVFIGPDTWRGYRTLEHDMRTDDAGRFEWRGAPPDGVEYSILKKGYMSKRDYVLKALPEEILITLSPVLVISGRVTNAATGEPIPKFRVRHGMEFAGRDQIYWTGDEGVEYTDGSYSFTFDEPHAGSYLRVIAPGFVPADSRKFESNEGPQTLDFQLQAGQGPSGLVLLPGGEPAVDAEVGLATRSNSATLENGYFDRRQNRAELVKTDGEGRFAFPPLPQADEPYLLIAVDEAGFAEITRDDFEKSSRITLEPWGRLEGRALLGAEPDVDREVSIYPVRPNRTVMFVFTYGYSTKTDRDGRFQFERVMPGSASVSRTVVTEFLESSQHSPGWQMPVEVTSNKTASVTIGGTGRAVVGRVVLDREPDVEIDWTLNEPVAIQRSSTSENKRDQPHFRGIANLDRSGRFRVPDVPAGDYQLALRVNNPPVPNACGAGAPIGRATHSFTVPEMPGGRSDEPFDLGQLTATLFDTLDAGELAPDFVARGLSGDDFRLSEMSGKLVLLDFWATWCGPCLAEMPALKEIHDEFGGGERFAIVGLSCDQAPEPARQYLEKAGLGWRQAHVGATAAGVAAKYAIRALPATFLIAPNGRVLAKNLRGNDLKNAVAAALNDDDLFQADGEPRPARFPVVRFEVPAEPSPLPEEPAVVLLDNSDPTFERDQPHADGLSLLSGTGKELWAQREFNNSQTVAGVHAVAVDRRNGRIFVSENTADRITAFTLQGNKLWQVSQIETGSLCVDPRTGHVWSSGGPLLNRGETVVLDGDGREISAFPHRGIDMVYDPHTDAFWQVGYRLIKVNRQGEILFDKRVDGWMCGSVSVNPGNGSVWIGERDHSDVARSRNRLWHLDAQGKVLRDIPLGKFDPFVVEYDPATDTVWVGNWRQGLRRVRPDESPAEPLPIKPYNISISPTTGQMWVVTEDDLLRLDEDGKVVDRFGLGKPSQQAWLEAF